MTDLNETYDSEPEIAAAIDQYKQAVETRQGAEKVFAYISWIMLSQGYYVPDELISLSMRDGFYVDNPLNIRIRRGTKIATGATLKNGAAIQGENCTVGSNSIIDGAQINGNYVVIGNDNQILGNINIDRVSLGNHNLVYGLRGVNHGNITIGSSNSIFDVEITNKCQGSIVIGNHNELHRGLSINSLYKYGNIRIGNCNSLGRDGGGVISTAYRFSNSWWGHVLIGSNVETTRGAEILGFSLIGWPLTSDNDLKAQSCFLGSLENVREFMETVWDYELPDESVHPKLVSMFGVVKTKMCCLNNNVTFKDGTRVQRSYVRKFIIQERSNIYFSNIHPDTENALKVTQQDRAIEHQDITEAMDLANLPTETKTDGYLYQDDQKFYDQWEGADCK